MSQRRMIDVPLRSVPSDRFQPTGFPDLGAAPFEKPVRDGEETRWVDALLVESAQSMANRLEAMGWDDNDNAPADVLAGLPYVEVRSEDGEDYLTSSRTEAHRLSSAFIRKATLGGSDVVDEFKKRFRLDEDRPLSYTIIAQEVFKLDPLCLLHGVFFSDKGLPAQPKITRAVTAMVEAVDIRPAHEGGVKKDAVRHSLGEGGGTEEGYGFVPYHRTLYTAAEITLLYSLDLAQLRSYGLSEPATELLEAIAYWQLGSLVEDGLRLRTACEFEPLSDAIIDRDGEPLGPPAQQAGRIRELIVACPELEGVEMPTVVHWMGKKGRA